MPHQKSAGPQCSVRQQRLQLRNQNRLGLLELPLDQQIIQAIVLVLKKL
jgi:hypothetical protein